METISRKILCVDDEVRILHSLKRELRRKFDVTMAISGREGLDLLHREGPFAVVIADYNMPGMNGVEFLREVRRVAPDTVNIMLTGAAKLDVAVAAFHEGHIYRFLTKPWSQENLEHTVAECLEHYCVLEERRPLERLSEQAQNDVLRAARIDPLMEICNRATFDDYHADLHRRMTAADGRYALMMADVDNFKKFNDHYGHAEGDKVLRAVATTMSGSLRHEQDFIARYGGEEVIVLCEDASEDVATKIGERLRSSVCGLNLPHAHNPDHGCVTISLGIAVSNLAVGEGPDELLIRADHALYAAKRKGRNRVEIASPPAPAKNTERAVAE